MQKKLKKNKQNLSIDQIKYLTGLNLWNYGGICKAIMIRQLKQRKETMTKKNTVKKTKRKKENEFQKVIKKKLRSQFSGLKFKNLGDGMTEISFN